MELAGATALVTGANRGIGLALARSLAQRPLDLLMMGMRSPERGPELQPPPGGAREIRPVALDLSSRGTVEEGSAGLGDALHRIDLLVNNAGLMTGGLLEEQDTEQVYAMFQVNLVAVCHLTQMVLPGMLSRGHGKVVNNTSISGYAHLPGATTYAASKAGVVAFTEALRRELAGTGVSALHLVTPGVKTDMLDDTEAVYGRHMDTSGWNSTAPERWAARVLRAIEADDHILGPGGRLAAAKLASRGPAMVMDALASRMFSRAPRR